MPDGSDLQAYGGGALNPYDLDLVGNTLYWSDQNGNKIFTIDSINDPTASQLLVSGLSRPFAIDGVGGEIYWSEVDGTDRIRRTNLDDTDAVMLISGEQSYDFEITDQ